MVYLLLEIVIITFIISYAIFIVESGMIHMSARIIRQMVEDGLIEKAGNNRYAYYALKSREAKRIEDE